jgi:hypothetical protein
MHALRRKLVEFHVKIEWKMISQSLRLALGGVIGIVDQENHGIGSLGLATESGQACFDPWGFVSGGYRDDRIRSLPRNNVDYFRRVRVSHRRVTSLTTNFDS